jgi:hypothetical protein
LKIKHESTTNGLQEKTQLEWKRAHPHRPWSAAFKTRQKASSVNPESSFVGELIYIAEILFPSVFIRVHPWLN